MTKIYGQTTKKPAIFFGLALILGLLGSLSSGCSPAAGIAPATATAQALRAKDMATQMALNLQATYAVEDQRATATLQAIQTLLAARGKWPLLIEDPFDENTRDWPIGSKEDPLAIIDREISGGKYHWSAQALDGFVWWVYPEMDPVSDIYLAADMQQLAGPPDGEYGITYRVTEEDEYYLFEIDAQGQFAVFLHSQEEWVTLLDWTESPAIQQSGVNRLAVLAHGPEFLFFINDHLVGSLRDTNLASGKTGALIGLARNGDQGVWEFDNYELRAYPLDSPDLTSTPNTPTP